MATKKNTEEKIVESAETGADTAPDAAAEIVAETAVEAAPAPKAAKKTAAAKKNEAPKGDDSVNARDSHRAQKVGIVSSDKMMKSCVVRVDRLVKHPKYRRYVRRRSKFMAHNELGAASGDKVRIVETRPLSARKRWRVVEIIQKAEK
jgi:small subunit ribosomal protein S17